MYIDKVSAHQLKHVLSQYLETPNDVDTCLADIVLLIGYNEDIEYTDKELYTALHQSGMTMQEIATLRNISTSTVSRAINN